MKVIAKITVTQDENAVILDISEPIGEFINWTTWTYEGVSFSALKEKLSEAEKISNNVIIRFNCVGGDVHDGQHMFNLIAQSKANISFEITAAHSMGSVLAQAVKKGNRKMYKNGIMMIHAASVEMWGPYNSSQIEETLSAIKTYDKTLAAALSKHTGLSEDEIIAKWLDGKDHFFTAKEALEANLIDEIIEDEIENISANNIKKVFNAIYNNDLSGKSVSNENIINRIANKVSQIITNSSVNKNKIQNIMSLKNLRAELQQALDKKENLIIDLKSIKALLDEADNAETELENTKNEKQTALNDKSKAENDLVEEKKTTDTLKAKITDLEDKISKSGITDEFAFGGNDPNKNNKNNTQNLGTYNKY